MPVRRVAGVCLSVGSVGSFLSIGSMGSILSIGSVGSFLSVGSLGSSRSLFSVKSKRAVGNAPSKGHHAMALKSGKPEPSARKKAKRCRRKVALAAAVALVAWAGLKKAAEKTR